MSEVNETLDQAGIFAALMHYYPEGFTEFNEAAPSPTTYAEYAAWFQATPLSEGDMLVGRDATLAVKAGKAARSLQRQALRDQWDQLPPFIRGPFREKFDSINMLLDAGDDDAARALVQYAEPPATFSPEELQVFSSVRASFLQAISSLPT